MLSPLMFCTRLERMLSEYPIAIFEMRTNPDGVEGKSFPIKSFDQKSYDTRHSLLHVICCRSQK
jgi:hypothetical protein